MVEDWQPITREKPEILGIDSEYSGLLNVRISLSRSPEPEWQQFFLHPVNVSMSMSMHPPRLQGSGVYLQPPDNEVEKYIRHVDERITAANTRYQHEVLPRVRARQEREEAERAEQERRLEEARQRVAGL